MVQNCGAVMAFLGVNTALLKSRRGLEILGPGGSIIVLLNIPGECSDVAHAHIVAAQNGIAPQTM
jgi:hypothetical protein